jgi:hypothetical protein
VASGLAGAIRGHVFEHGQPGFDGVAHVFNTRFDHVLPSAVARPVDGTDVRDAIRFTVAHGIHVRARSGGHSYAGYSTLANGVVLDLRKLDAIHFNRTAGTATIGAGAQLIDIYSTLSQHGVIVPGGSCPSVGIAGSTLGGGFGLAARHLGLTIDSLEAVKIVTADGQLRTVDNQSDPDLLWALKGGGGGNFGVVTEFTFKVHPIPANATYFQVNWPWSSADEAIAAWQSWAPHTTGELTSILHLNSSGPSIEANGQYLGSSGSLPAIAAPLLGVPGANLAANVEKPYLQIQLLLAGCEGRTVSACHTVGAGPSGTLPRESFDAKSDYVAQPLPSAGRAAMIAAAEHPGQGRCCATLTGARSSKSLRQRPRSSIASHCSASSTTATAATRPGSIRRTPSSTRSSRAARTRTTSIRRSTTGSARTTVRIFSGSRRSEPTSIPTITSRSRRRSGAESLPSGRAWHGETL